MERGMTLLAEGALELGIRLDDGQLGLFETYYRELACWNRRVNLTSVADRRGAQVKHFLDSLTVCLAAGKPLPEGLRVIDVGAGAGFPGLPLKIAFPGIRLALVDSVGKKTAFLRHLTAALELSGVEAHTGRAEELAHDTRMREAFDLAVSRGVAKLATLAEYTLPFCRTGGMSVALKHGGLEGETAAAARSLEVLGGRLKGLHPVEVAGLADNRVVVAVEKTGPTPPRYPRRPGMPARRPL